MLAVVSRSRGCIGFREIDKDLAATGEDEVAEFVSDGKALAYMGMGFVHADGDCASILDEDA